jgi:hypothetical protein
VLDPRNSLGEFGEPLIDQRERIAAGEDYFVDFRQASDLLERGLPVGERLWRLLIRKMPPETVPAVNGTRPGRDQ